MKNFILLLIGAFLFPLVTYAECKSPEIGSSFVIEKPFLIDGLDAKHDIEDDFVFGNLYASDYGVSYSGSDQSGVYDIYARKRYTKQGMLFVISDCKGNKIGSIKEVLDEGYIFTTATYIIEDVVGNVIAVSDETESNARSITFRTTKGKTIATMERPRFSLKSKVWSFYIESREVDSRFYLLIAMYRMYKQR